MVVMCGDDELDELMLEDPHDLRMREILERGAAEILEEAHKRDPTVTREEVAERLCQRRPEWGKWL